MRNVAFDLDGTLIDSVPGIQWSVEAAMRDCGITRACPDLAPLIGPPIRGILTIAAGTADHAELDRLERAFRKNYDADGWRRAECQPGVRPMLEQLRTAGCAMSIVTNKPTHATTLILPALGIRNYFGEIVCRDSATPPFTSKAQMLIDLLERQAILADETLMVGDTLEDCHAAAAAGIACALVPHGYGHPIEGDLPAGCLRIAGWDGLVAICSSSVFTKVNVALSGVMKG